MFKKFDWVWTKIGVYPSWEIWNIITVFLWYWLICAKDNLILNWISKVPSIKSRCHIRWIAACLKPFCVWTCPNFIQRPYSNVIKYNFWALIKMRSHSYRHLNSIMTPANTCTPLPIAIKDKIKCVLIFEFL